MPELPEVETVRLGLRRLVVGEKVASVENDTEKSFPNERNAVDEFLLNATVIDVRRRAKVLLIDLSTNYTLMVHLKMTGQLVYVSEDVRFGAGHPNDSLVNQLPDRSTRVTITFTSGGKLYFNDQRKFGWMKLLPTQLVPEDPFMLKVGPEPLENSFTPELFIERLKRRKNTSIKAAILDQTVLAGIGNIYADEGLWGAMIHPSTPVKDVAVNDLKKLHTELVDVLKLSIEKGGSTDRNYVDAEGRRGSYIDFARVFRREGLACPRCSSPIEKIRVAGRGTHVCSQCQKRTQ